MRHYPFAMFTSNLAFVSWDKKKLFSICVGFSPSFYCRNKCLSHFSRLAYNQMTCVPKNSKQFPFVHLPQMFTPFENLPSFSYSINYGNFQQRSHFEWNGGEHKFFFNFPAQNFNLNSIIMTIIDTRVGYKVKVGFSFRKQNHYIDCITTVNVIIHEPNMQITLCEHRKLFFIFHFAWNDP